MATFTFDGPNKIITIHYEADITETTAREIYSAWKRWVKTGNAQYLPAFADSIGGNDIGGGVKLGYYCFLDNEAGWRLTADDLSYTIVILGEFYTTDPTKPFIIPVGNQTVNVLLQRSVGALAVSGGGGTSGSGGASASEIAKAVWDEPMTPHSLAGTFGWKAQQDTSIDSGEIADAVWDEYLSGHQVPGTAGAALDDAATKPAFDPLYIPDIADAVWDEKIADHQSEGSTGESLDTAATKPAFDPSYIPDIADAVWEEPMEGYESKGTFGERIRQLFPSHWNLK